MNSIPKSAFEFVPPEGRMHDKKLETKPVGYFRDAMNRFGKNRSSVVAFYIILVLVLYAILVPIFCETTYSKSLTDTNYLKYAKLPPKMPILGIDGTSRVTVNKNKYIMFRALEEETGLPVIREVFREDYADSSSGNRKNTFYDLRIDKYAAMGMLSLSMNEKQFEELQDWQDQTGIQVIYPAITDAKQNNPDIWYESDKKGQPKLTKDGNLKPIYKKTTPEDTLYHSLRIPADNDPEHPLAYARITGTSSARTLVVRVSKYSYFQYCYGFEPSFVFGTNAKGQDIFTRLATGARFSFLLAICISVINLFIGTIYGAVQGYYGGTVDLVMDRIADILYDVPFMVVTTLFQLHLANKVGIIPALLFAFVLTGWIGMAARVRMQFYRFKNQEYVLAARTLGARDRRLMFRHIFPNSLGTIITGSILVIPGVIFSESSLTYLGIINLESSALTSVGTMLANGKDYLATDPYIIFFPALFISLLEVSFNLFGNGLRDAFNPSLRGVE